jgi:hypothetical protein
MLTAEQRGQLADAFMSAGILASDQRARFIGAVLPTWIHGGDLGFLTSYEARQLLTALANRGEGTRDAD